MEIIADGFTDKGLVRKINQDAIMIRHQATRLLAIVADGMGGHEHGEIASRLLVERLGQWWEDSPEPLPFTQATAQMHNVIAQANRQIWGSYGANGNICGTTLALLYISGINYTVMNIGDSRVYRFNKGHLSQLSQDHTWGAGQPVENNAIKPTDDPRYGKLTQAVGGAIDTSPFVRSEPLESDCLFLICSDGAYRYYTNQSLRRWMLKLQKKSMIPKSLEQMKQYVYARGAKDNLSAIAIQVKMI